MSAPGQCKMVGNVPIQLRQARPGRNRSQKHHSKTEVNMRCNFVDKQRKLLLFVWHPHVCNIFDPVLWEDPQQQSNRFFQRMM